ncbi:hypothetical protein ACFV06_31490 [Streptomyces sp. NPDC059618]|uniref:hypothetical protein n=1 Tax=Streptomyces sp. NPDC059618 TaxID=3346887 RepID=UPI0036CC884E
MASMTAELQVPPLLSGGQVIACPVCGQGDNLTLVIVPGDFSEDPSDLFCDDMHRWSEPRVPRRIGAGVYEIREREAPETIDWSGAS